MKITIIRTNYTTNETSGTMLLDGDFFGYTLEDTVRFSPKIKHKTAIPPGLYRVTVSYSPRFKRNMPQILQVPGFTGVRIHGGNTHKNTSGCPLVAKNRQIDGDGIKIWGSLERKLTTELQKTHNAAHYIEIINTLEV